MRRRPQGRRRSVDRGTRRPAIELRNLPSGVPTLLCEAEGHTEGGDIGKPPSDPAQSKTLCMRGNSPHGKREIPQAPTERVSMGRPEKANGRTSGVHAWGKSDDCVVPEKPPNKGEPVSPAEAVEGRRSTKGSTMAEATSRTQSRIDVPLSRHRARCPGMTVPPP